MSRLLFVLSLVTCIMCTISKQNPCVTYRNPIIINTEIDDKYSHTPTVEFNHNTIHYFKNDQMLVYDSYDKNYYLTTPINLV